MDDRVEEAGQLPRHSDGGLQSPREALDRLNRRIHATKSIRFRSHDRLMRRHKLSSYVVAMLSIYVIAISLMPNIYTLSSKQNQVLLACTIVMSTFIICLVLTEGYESFHHKADVLHDSARKLNHLSFELVLYPDPSLEKMRDISLEYNKILQDCPLNHAQCDYLWVKARYPEWFGFVPPNVSTSGEGKILGRIRQIFDWSQSVTAEFVPLTFCAITAFAMFKVIYYGWPDGHIVT